MKLATVAILGLIGLTTGCSNFYPSPYGSPTNPRNIPCNATPPNQPGCYDRQNPPGLLNLLFDDLNA